jgi:hypothetical protein
MTEELTNVKVDNSGKPKKLDPVGLSLYGTNFKGFNKVAEYNDILPAFKDWYYEIKKKEPNTTLTVIVRGFNEEVCKPMGRTFYPYLPQLRGWRAKWDLDLMNQLQEKGLAITEKRYVNQVIKTRNEEGRLVTGQVGDSELEAGVKTLGGELLNDAMQMLKDDQELEEIYDDETLIKRRHYIVNVFAHATRLVHGKAALMLKASEEKRNTAGFMMSLIARATAGKMTDEEMKLLKDAYVPKSQPNEQAQPI